jgi:hypothetical protein
MLAMTEPSSSNEPLNGNITVACQVGPKCT